MTVLRSCVSSVMSFFSFWSSRANSRSKSLASVSLRQFCEPVDGVLENVAFLVFFLDDCDH